MDTQYLKAIWDKACEKQRENCERVAWSCRYESPAGSDEDLGIDQYVGSSTKPAFELPYFDQAQQLVEFIKNHDLKALQRMKQPLTQEDASWLLSRYSIEDIEGVLMDMENYPRLNSKYKSCKLTANNWLRKRTKDNGKNKSNQKIRIV